MRTKKTLLLSFLLGVMMLVSVTGIANAASEVLEEIVVLPVCGNGQVEAGEQCDDGNSVNTDLCLNNCETPFCNLIVDEPEQGKFYDPITVTWHLEGNACNPLYYTVQYNTNCNSAFGWKNITTNLDPETNPMSIKWLNLPLQTGQCGQYCVRVNMVGTSCAPGCCSITENTGLFSIDLANPEVDLSVGNPQYEFQAGDCDEGEGTCYVNQDTEITLSCTDENPDEICQSGPKEISYRINGGEWMTYDGPFKFEEDSNHLLEYRCFDEVGKMDSESKSFVVETVAPELTRTVTGPQVCPEESEECAGYFNLDTEICVSAVDPTPHPSNNVVITCDWWYGDVKGQLTGHHGSFTLNEENECFSYTEDSFHTLECTATDALGNSVTVPWLDIVDAKKPITTLSYTGPYYTDRVSKWIDGVSTVVLTAEDQQPHPVGVDKTYYRYGVVADKYCLGDKGEVSLGDDVLYTEYTAPFSMEESCHLIEYYSVDKLGNAEVVKQEFVFVDKTAPKTIKEVGNPSTACLLNCNPTYNWYLNSEQKIEWKVTLDTPITISCEDQSPHPSGVAGIWYRVVLDGQYESEKSSWKFVPSSSYEFWFAEESEHLLEFKCVDNVNKTSQVDSEIFKVEGHSFEIPLNEKWNLISVPVNLLSSDIENVFSGEEDKIIGVWGYENGEWKVYVPGVTGELTDIIPGHGYWVKTTEATSILIGGDLFSEAVTPSDFNLDKGWNLIGHYGIASKPAYCSLFSLVDTQQGFPRWSALWGYNSATQKFVPLNTNSVMDAGKGYWVEMDVEDEYSPSSICYGFQA